MTATVPDPTHRARLAGRARLLAGASVAYNVVEAVIAIAAGVAASSTALIAFGLDSLIEVSSGAIILWQLRRPLSRDRERLALRLIGLSFFALAAYVLVGSVRSLAAGPSAEASVVGIALAAASLAVMPLLSLMQRRTGRAMHSTSVVADSKQTLLCSYLSAVLLAGLLANALLGWWWADPVAALVIAAVAAREGWQAWRGESCSCSSC